MEPVILTVDWEDVAASVTAHINTKLEEANQGHLMVCPGSFEVDPQRAGSFRVSLVERPGRDLPEPRRRTLAEFLDGQASPTYGDVIVKTIQERTGGVLPLNVAGLAEPPPLVLDTHAENTKLYNAPPEISPEAKAAFAALQAAGIVDAHLTPELLASQSREDVLDGVGEVLKGGYVKGTTPPAGHPDDPHKNKPWRRSVATEVQGALRQTEG